MTGNFFETLSAEEKQRIQERASALADLLTEWVQYYPLVRTVRIPSVALLIAAIAPRLNLPASLLVTKMLLWIFELDDRIDEHTIPWAELQAKIDAWHLIARDGPKSESPESDELAAILLSIRADLSQFFLFEPLGKDWALNVHLLVEAMTQEYQYGLRYRADPAQPLPTLDEYLRYGAYSIGFPAWAFTTLIVLSDSSVLDCRESLDPAFQCAGTAIRLYNDYQTFDKEVQEGKVNSAVILYYSLLGQDSDTSKGQLWTEVRQRVLQLADAYAQKCGGLVKQIHTASGQIEEALSRIVSFSADFYREHDYHTTSAAETKALLEGTCN